MRKRRSQTQYLLLQATTDPDDWVLPKGHIELGEDARRCAIREVKEETGVWARIREELRVSEYQVEGKAVRVQFYLMEVVDRGRQEDPLRKHKWLSFDEALDSTEHQEVKELLIFADQLQFE